MSNKIRSIEPVEVWNHFADINAIPRASKKEEQIIAFMVDFGKKLGLETIVDPVQNVIIKKRATTGMENRKTVVLQSHLDMVHQKNNDTEFDFDTDGIKMHIDGDWVKADGTTLGADNGLGVAAIMSVLASNTIVHPAIEALFTIDEETGMTGAMGLQPGYLSGEILLNLDTEDDDEIGVGCAGGIDVTAIKTYETKEVSSNSNAFKISVKGLQGGHSGMDIDKGFGNANKLMNRVLHALNDCIHISEIDGGSLRNAIPRESNTIIVSNDISKLKITFEEIKNTILQEFNTLEAALEITLTETNKPTSTLSKKEQKILINTLYSAYNGVYRMSPDIDNLVETSNNIARVIVKNGEIKILCLTRSSIETGKWDLAHKLKATFDLGDFTTEFGGSYPGWKPNPNSPILKVMSEIYEKLFLKKPKVLACHAGLECGLLGTHYPTMDMISFGPTIKGAHSPEELASISSTQKFWEFLIDILKNTPTA